MTTEPDPVWTALAESWRSPDPDPSGGAAMRRRVDRETERLRWIGWAEVTLTVLGLVGLPMALAAGRLGFGWVVAGLIHTVAVAGFAAWNRQGVWQPLGESTLDYLRLARERGRRKFRTARFVQGVIAIEGAALLAWLAAPGGPGLDAVSATAIGVGVVVTAAGSEWYRRRVRSELDRLAAAEEELQPVTQPSESPASSC
jgi:hypothetical protein